MTYSACPEVLSFPSEFVVNKDCVSPAEAQKTAVLAVIVHDGLHSAHWTYKCTHTHTHVDK